jgi:hypothetical protein
MLGLDLNHMAINKLNLISFGLTFKVEPFLLVHPKWLLHFHVYSDFQYPNALLYIFWIHKMEAKQHGIKKLVVT